MNNLAILHRTESAPDDWTLRQRQVLDATLSLLIENAANITMIGVARKASCSKETLYKWFGDRDGLLVATVRYQASKVKVEPFDDEGMTQAKLSSILLVFATDLLTILTSKTSIALNRLAIAQAHQGTDSINMGSIVLQNGRFSTGPRLKPALVAGMKAGLLRQSDSEDAFRSFYGLVVRDVHIRVLLGDTMTFTADEISTEADRAVHQFYHLYGAEISPKT